MESDDGEEKPELKPDVKPDPSVPGNLAESGPIPTETGIPDMNEVI